MEASKRCGSLLNDCAERKGLAKTRFGLFSSSVFGSSGGAARPKTHLAFCRTWVLAPNLPPLKKAPIEGAFLMAERMAAWTVILLSSIVCLSAKNLFKSRFF